MPTLYLLPWSDLEPRAHMAGRRVVVPNRHAATALGVPYESLERLASARLARSVPTEATALVAQRALIAACAAQGQRDAQGTAQALSPVLKELLRAGATPEALEASGRPRAQRLGRLLAAYQAQLAALGAFDSAERLRRSTAASHDRLPILLTGYPRLGQDECEFVAAIAAPDSVVLLPFQDEARYADNARAAEFFAERGWTIERRAGTGAWPPLPTPVGLRYADQEEEVRGVLARVKALLHSGVAAEQIGLVARDETAYGPFLTAVAWEYGVPVRLRYSESLAGTRLGAWLALWAEALESGGAFEATFRWLCHPYSRALSAEARQAAREQHPSDRAAWEALGIADETWTWPASAPRSAWLAHLGRALDHWKLGRRARRSARETLALAALKKFLPQLAEPGAEHLTRRDFLGELKAALALVQVPVQPGTGGVELHTPLSIFGAQYEHLFVLGMAENVLPAAIVDNPALDFHERRQIAGAGLQLEDAAAAARREFLSFAAALASAKTALTLSCPGRYAAKEALPSAYYAELACRPEADEHRAIASPEEARRFWLNTNDDARDPLLGAVRAAWAAERRREGPDAPDAHDGVIGLPLDLERRTFSATQLTTLGQCPFRWFAQYALRLRDLEEAEDDLAPNVRGSLYHATLERALADLPAETDMVEGALARLKDAFAEAEALLQLTHLPAWGVRREEHLALLRRAVQGETFRAEGARVAALEGTFKATWRGLRVRGSVDRLDQTPEGLVLIDYKTSGTAPKGAQDAEGKAKLDLQLPLYMEAAAPDLYPGEPVAGARYYSLTKAEVLKEAVPDAAALDAFVDGVRARFATGSFPVAPDVERHACQYCDVALVCRKGPRLDRKPAAGKGV